MSNIEPNLTDSAVEWTAGQVMVRQDLSVNTQSIFSSYLEVTRRHLDVSLDYSVGTGVVQATFYLPVELIELRMSATGRYNTCRSHT